MLTLASDILLSCLCSHLSSIENYHTVAEARLVHENAQLVATAGHLFPYQTLAMLSRPLLSTINPGVHEEAGSPRRCSPLLC